MARPLAVIAVIGIAVSFICLALAAFLQPGSGFPYPLGYRLGSGDSWLSITPWREDPPFVESGEVVTRDLPWSGGDRVEISLPGVVHFKRGPEWRITVTGRESSVRRLRIDDGSIHFDAPGVHSDSPSLEIRITAPSLRHIGLNGSGELILEDLHQQAIEINIRGSGTVQGTGSVEKLELRIFGSGNAHLEHLSAVDVDTTILGSGDAEVSPTGNADLVILGSGDIRLATRPKHLSSKVTGSGRVVELSAL